MQTIAEATAEYETALAAQMPLDAGELRYKHERMADPVDPFPFFRGTYYRWVRLFPELCSQWANAPQVLAVGDLHIENFGTWRDAETRLCWGVNDFDEAAELSYASDLIRLAASVRIAKRLIEPELKTADVCASILAGYTATLQAHGDPFVLEESHSELRALAMGEDPKKFWNKLLEKLQPPVSDVPDDARTLLGEALPKGAENIRYFYRCKAGMGSLGRPRIVVVCDHRGSKLAWEVKRAATPPTGGPNRASECVMNAIRSHDPAYQPGPRWVRRRLGPRYSKIELDQLKKADLTLILRAMGAETANVHFTNPEVAAAILHDLAKHSANWLPDAAKIMSKAIEEDWQAWRVHGSAG